MTKPPAGPVAPEWLDQQDGEDQKVIWLSNAWEVFGTPDHVERARSAAKRYADLCDGETPWMNLLSSGVELSQWRKARRSPQDEVWGAFADYCINRLAAEADVDARLHFGTLYAFGDPQHRGADPAWVPVRAWHGLKRDPNQQDVVRSGDLVYYYVRIVSAQQWLWSLAAKQAPDQVPIQPPPSEEVAAEDPTVVVESPSDDPRLLAAIEFMKRIHKENYDAVPRLRPPKVEDAYRNCKTATRATVRQMNAAMKHVPPEQRRGRGDRG